MLALLSQYTSTVPAACESLMKILTAASTLMASRWVMWWESAIFFGYVYVYADVRSVAPPPFRDKSAQILRTVLLCGIMAHALLAWRYLENQAKYVRIWSVTVMTSVVVALRAARRRATNILAARTTFPRCLMKPKIHCRSVLVILVCCAAAAKHLVMTASLDSRIDSWLNFKMLVSF